MERVCMCQEGEGDLKLKYECATFPCPLSANSPKGEPIKNIIKKFPDKTALVSNVLSYVYTCVCECVHMEGHRA